MALPKIKQPLFDVIIPSTKRGMKFRPFLGKEEKILLIAQSSGKQNDLVNALIQVIGNCVYDHQIGKPINVNVLTTFDLEYLFLKIRSKSVDNISTLTYLDTEDNKEYKFDVNLDAVEVVYDSEHTNKVKINEEVSMILKYPTALDVVGSLLVKDDVDMSNMLIVKCIDTIYDAEEVFPANESSFEELSTFLEDCMTHKVRLQIEKFFTTMPKLYHKITYKNSKGSEREIVLDSLEDFFTLG